MTPLEEYKIISKIYYERMIKIARERYPVPMVYKFKFNDGYTKTTFMVGYYVEYSFDHKGVDIIPLLKLLEGNFTIRATYTKASHKNDESDFVISSEGEMGFESITPQSTVSPYFTRVNDSPYNP